VNDRMVASTKDVPATQICAPVTPQNQLSSLSTEVQFYTGSNQCVFECVSSRYFLIYKVSFIGTETVQVTPLRRTLASSPLSECT